VEHKHAAREAFKQIFAATDLDRDQITEILNAHPDASVNDIVRRLREQSKIKRATW
jgi:hypothetical protein